MKPSKYNILIIVLVGLILVSLGVLLIENSERKQTIKSQSVIQGYTGIVFDDIREEMNIYSNTKYVLTIQVKEMTYSIGLGDHPVDELNAVDIDIPVDKEYYDSLEVGDIIDTKFYMGNVVLKNITGRYSILVIEKREVKTR